MHFVGYPPIGRVTLRTGSQLNEVQASRAFICMT